MFLRILLEECLLRHLIAGFVHWLAVRAHTHKWSEIRVSLKCSSIKGQPLSHTLSPRELWGSEGAMEWTVSSGKWQDTRDSQQLWLFVQDLHKISPVNTTAPSREEPRSSYTLLRSKDSWCCEERKSPFFRIWPLYCTMIHQMAAHLCAYGQHQLDSVDYFKEWERGKGRG